MRARSFMMGFGVLIALLGGTMGCDRPTSTATPVSASGGEARALGSASSASATSPAPSATESAGGPSSPSPSASATAGAPPLLDLSTLATRAKSLDGTRVRVVGTTFEGAFELGYSDGSPTLGVKHRTCTHLECSPSKPCCNRCGSAVSLRGKELIGVRLVDKSNSTRFACGGDDCSMTCTPVAGRYEAIGTFRIGPGGELDLEVETLTPLP